MQWAYISTMLWKLLFTIAVVFLVWMVFKKMALANRPGHQGESRTERIRRAAEDAVRARTGEARDREPAAKPVDLIQCPSCGNYVAPGAACSCGWKDKG